VVVVDVDAGPVDGVCECTARAASKIPTKDAAEILRIKVFIKGFIKVIQVSEGHAQQDTKTYAGAGPRYFPSAMKMGSHLAVPDVSGNIPSRLGGFSEFGLSHCRPGVATKSASQSIHDKSGQNDNEAKQ